MKASIKIVTRLNSTTVAGVLADLDPPTELSENIILNVLVGIDNSGARRA